MTGPCRNVAVSSSQTRPWRKIPALVARKYSSRISGGIVRWRKYATTLIKMIVLQAGAAPDNQPEPRVSPR